MENLHKVPENLWSNIATTEIVKVVQNKIAILLTKSVFNLDP